MGGSKKKKKAKKDSKKKNKKKKKKHEEGKKNTDNKKDKHKRTSKGIADEDAQLHKRVDANAESSELSCPSPAKDVSKRDLLVAAVERRASDATSRGIGDATVVERLRRRSDS